MVTSGLLQEIRCFEEVILSTRECMIVFVKVEQTKTYEFFTADYRLHPAGRGFRLVLERRR